MSVEASQDGGFELADILADAASKYLDRAEAVESAHVLPLRQRGQQHFGEGSSARPPFKTAK
jgi:hypothetical protein